VLVVGWGPIGGIGIAGAALSTLFANAVSGVALLVYLLRRDGAVQLQKSPWRFRPDLMRVILRVGLPASLNPVISNASIAVATAVVGSFGVAALAGYGVAARLEYILVPIAFGFGTALTMMVATNMGAGKTHRAVRVAWLGGAVVAVITGAIGLLAAVAPALWMNLFTDDPAVREAGGRYLNIVGGCYGFFGLGLALFFASQGAGRMLWPVVGSAARLVIVAAGGYACMHWLDVSMRAYFVVVAVSLAVYGLTIAGAIWRGGWTRS
jgi:Na+-driven multidrug efflux pump